MKMTGSFGNWLKQRRKALDLTQQELADQVSCSVVTVRKIEQDACRPSKQIAERLADALVIAPEDRAAFVTFARHMGELQPALPVDLTALMPAQNLPPQPTPFIGREDALAYIADRLADPNCRLLTLIGPGGIGKTRLALQAVVDKVGQFTDGAFFVSLTPVGSTTLIAAAIASALQISFYSQEDPDIQVVNYLRGKHMLLLMDNYEHLLGGIGLLTNILANAPRLKVVVTSRERLNIQEEWVLPVEGLPFPTQEANGATENYSAVQLFVQSARRVQPAFSLDGNQSAVTDICRAVEGMPLGIELAATWLRAMPCQQIAGQIRRDLDFLTTPLRNVPERHRSLRAVFEHSWGLLSPIERDALMKLSVFRGGCDVAAAEQVAGASLWVLASLVDKSLVRVNPLGRYEMHELLRQFATDKLVESGKSDGTRQCHLQFYLGLAEQLERLLFGPHQLVAFDQLEVEIDNFRVALDWAAQVGETKSGLRLSGALGWFWNRRTRWHEGRKCLETFLALGSDVLAPARAKALHHLLELSFELAEYNYVGVLCEQGLALAHEVQELRIRAWLLSSVGFVDHFQKVPRQDCLEEALALFRKIGDQWGICETLGRLALASLERGETTRSGELLEEAIGLARQAGDKSVLSFALCLSACKDWYSQSKIDWQTERNYQEALELFRELRYKGGMVWALAGLGQIAQVWREDVQARSLFEQALVLGQSIGSKGFNIDCLIGLANVFCVQGEPDRAARILGAVGDPFHALYTAPTLVLKIDRLNYERSVAAARTQLGEVRFAAAFAEGQRMSLDRAIAYALDKGTYADAELDVISVKDSG